MRLVSHVRLFLFFMEDIDMANAGETIYRVKVGAPKKSGQVTILIKFKSGGGTKLKQKVTADIDENDTANEKAAKIVVAINAAIEARNENKGVEAAQRKIKFPSGTEVLFPEVYIGNKANFEVTGVAYNTGKTQESTSKKKLKLALLDPAQGRDRETAMVAFAGTPSAGEIEIRLGDRTVIRVPTAKRSELDIAQTVMSHLTEAGWRAEVTESEPDDLLAAEVWPSSVTIHDLNGDEVFVDVTDPEISYVISLDDIVTV